MLTKPRPEKAFAFEQLAPLSIARMLWKKKFLSLVVWAVFTGGTYAIVSRLPATWAAEALILVDSQKIPEKYVSSTVSTDLQDRLATISQQILSATRLEKLIDEFGLYKAEKATLVPEEILEKMRKDITIKLEKGWSGNRPGAFRVGYEGQDPTVVAQVANRLSNLFIEENLRTREVQAEGTSEFIHTQLDEAKKTLDELEAAVSKYKLMYNGELPQQEATLNGTLSRLQSALDANRDAINRAQQNKIMLENTLNVADSSAAALAAVIDVGRENAVDASKGRAGSAPVQVPRKPRKASESIQDNIDTLLLRYSPDHPEVRRLRAELERVKTLEEHKGAEENAAADDAAENIPAESATAAAPAPKKEKSTVASISSDLQLKQARERVKALQVQIDFAVKELEDRKADHEKILKELAVHQAQIQKLPVREQEMARVMRDYEMAKSNYKSLLDKKMSAEMATDMERRQKSERFTILDPAQIPNKPVKPNRPLLAGAGSVAGLVLGLLLGLGIELRKDLFLGEWELAGRFPVLGRLPLIEIPATAEEDPEVGGKTERPPKRGLRLAVVSSLVISVLAVIAAGFYLVSHRY